MTSSGAPPAYRPQAVASVQRTKTAAPPVYRPQDVASVQRIKTAAPPVNRPQAAALVQRSKNAAPPVYRPQAAASVQRVKAAAPPVYRPQAPALVGRVNIRSVPISDNIAKLACLQPKLVGSGASVLKLLRDRQEATVIYKFLYDKLDGFSEDIAIELMAGRTPNNFDFGKKTASFNATAINQALTGSDAAHLRFVYAVTSHELQHAYDSAREGRNFSFPTGAGAVSDFLEMENLYITELQAWQAEARSYLESGDKGNALVVSWLNLDTAVFDPRNEIWARIQHYTDGVFARYFPSGWNWNSKVSRLFLGNAKIKGRMDDLKAKFVERYQQRQ